MRRPGELRFGDLVRAEIYRKAIEWRRRRVVWFVGNFLIFGFGILCQQNLFGSGQSLAVALNAMAAWVGFLAASAGVAGELGRSRRTATIALIVSRDANRSVLRNTLALALGEMVMLLPSLLLLWACGCLFSLGWVDPLTLLKAGALGVVTGLMFGPSVWAMALFFRNEGVLVAALSLGFFVWIGLANPAHELLPLKILFAISPLRLMYDVSIISALVWLSFWLMLGASSVLLGALIIKFIREGGDLITDD